MKVNPAYIIIGVLAVTNGITFAAPKVLSSVSIFAHAPAMAQTAVSTERVVFSNDTLVPPQQAEPIAKPVQRLPVAHPATQMASSETDAEQTVDAVAL